MLFALKQAAHAQTEAEMEHRSFQPLVADNDDPGKRVTIDITSKSEGSSGAEHLTQHAPSQQVELPPSPTNSSFSSEARSVAIKGEPSFRLCSVNWMSVTRDPATSLDIGRFSL